MPVIEVTNLHKRYGTQVAVDDVSFTVEQGEIFGILGPNGAGKTTTVECLTGLRTPDEGSASVLGFDPWRERDEVRRCVGVQLQESVLPDKVKVGEVMELYASFYRAPADWRQLLDELGLAAKRGTYYRRLSGGQKQRLSIALALVGNPRIAVLDELTTGLDPQARRDTWDLIARIRDRGVTVVLVTHFMDEAERLCDRLAIIDSGRVVAVDSPSAIVSAVDATQRLTFRATADLDALLAALPEVSHVSRDGDRTVVAGDGDLLAAVVGALGRHGATPADLRVEQASLEDAFVALTGRRLEH